MCEICLIYCSKLRALVEPHRVMLSFLWLQRDEFCSNLWYYVINRMLRDYTSTASKGSLSSGAMRVRVTLTPMGICDFTNVTGRLVNSFLRRDLHTKNCPSQNRHLQRVAVHHKTDGQASLTAHVSKQISKRNTHCPHLENIQIVDYKRNHIKTVPVLSRCCF